MAWVKQIPAWVWLLLAAWRLPGAVMALLALTALSPHALVAEIGSVASIAVFLVLAWYRVRYWSRSGPDGRVPEEPGP